MYVNDQFRSIGRRGKLGKNIARVGSTKLPRQNLGRPSSRTLGNISVIYTSVVQHHLLFLVSASAVRCVFNSGRELNWWYKSS